MDGLNRDMNRDRDLSLPTPAVSDTISPAWTFEDHEYRTAAELAGLCLTGLPATKRRINILARREGWQQLGSRNFGSRNFGPGKARKRRGSGGGWEYHVSCLPEAAQDDYRRRQEAQRAETQKAGPVAESAPQGVTMAARTAVSLNARQRRVMEARAAVLRKWR